MALAAAGDGRAARRAARHLAGRYVLDATAAAVVRALAGPAPPALTASRRDRLEGFAARAGAGVSGWAWHPADPDRDPELILLSPGGAPLRRFVARRLAPAPGSAPMSRRRAFRLARVPAGPCRLVGADGRDLWGSPLHPRDLAAAAPPAMLPAAAPRPPGVAVVVPVHGGGAAVARCLASVRATLRADDRLIVVDDASPDRALIADLHARHAAGELQLVVAADPPANRGFPAAANAGLRAAGGRDAILLNSDTLVVPGWIAALEAVAHAAPDTGSVTPVGNEAGRFSLPDPEGGPMPPAADLPGLARLAAAANAGTAIEAPTGHGFCLYLRADCLAAVGLFREDVFAQGYGEENDWSERARAAGYRHLIAPGIYVAHEGGASFGTARAALMARNMALLHQLHPTYHARVAAFIAADPLRASRERFDRARWAAGRRAGAVLLITHKAGGGTARLIQRRIAAIEAEGLRAIQIAGGDGLSVLVDGEKTYPNLRFRLPADFEPLAALLREDQPVRAELHHWLGHHHAITRLPAELGIPCDIWVHDWAWICPRITLVTGGNRYCGEPPPAACDACVGEWGRAIDERIGAARLRARSARDLAAAARVIVASEDGARRIRRHFPAARIAHGAWESPAPFIEAAQWSSPRRIAVIGAIGYQKGYDVLLACAQDARVRALPLAFTVIGYTVADEPLLDVGVTITGPFEAAEAVPLIRAARAALAFLPSIWPETWCYALSDAWAAGLPAVVLDIGAPAERVRAAGRGSVLPLGLPPARINDALLNIQPLAFSPREPRAPGGAGQGVVA